MQAHAEGCCIMDADDDDDDDAVTHESRTLRGRDSAGRRVGESQERQ